MSIGRILAVAGALVGAAVVVDALCDNKAERKRRKGKPRKKSKRTNKENRMASKKRAFISFDYDHDLDLKTMLVGQAKHDDTPFDIADFSIKEHQTGDWKEKARTRIKGCDVVIVMCGEYTHTAKGVAIELEIAQEEESNGVRYFLLWGRNGKTCTKPTSAKSGDKIYEWTWDNLKNLINGSR